MLKSSTKEPTVSLGSWRDAAPKNLLNVEEEDSCRDLLIPAGVTSAVVRPTPKNLLNVEEEDSCRDLLIPAQIGTGGVALSIYPSQLVGPLAGGRLAVCFEQPIRWPWWWALELGLKMALGVSLAVPWSVVTRSVFAQISVVVLALTAAYHAYSHEIYGHWLANLVAAASWASTALVVAVKTVKTLVPALVPMASWALVGTAVLPIAVALAATLLLGSALAGRLLLGSAGSGGQKDGPPPGTAVDEETMQSLY